MVLKKEKGIENYQFPFVSCALRSSLCGQAFTAFAAAAVDNLAAVAGGHTLAEPVFILSFTFAWFECH